MTAQTSTIPETLKKDQITFQEILSDDELAALFAKYGVQDERHRKLFVRCFFWLMIFSAGEPSRRGSLLSLIGFFIGAMAQLYPEADVTSLSKTAVSKRLINVSWYLFRGVYNHLLDRYKKILNVQDVKFLGQFKDAFLVDGSVRCSPANTLIMIWLKFDRQRGFGRRVFRKKPAISDVKGRFIVNLAHNLATETP